MQGTSFPSLGRRLRWLALASLLLANPALGQSAADKATARKLATDGIELYQAGKYSEALDKLNRAESMYDAPVHLLYIARSQAKLGQLVEATETYRRLVRVKLEGGAPQAFKEAIESGKGELAALEPTIPSLRVDVTPANVANLEIVIGTEKVSAASVGIDRPANPGRHEISVSAPGYEPAKASVELKAGQKKNVALELKALPGGPPPPTPPAAGGATTPGTGTPGGPDAGVGPATPEKPRGKFGFFAGLRLSGAIPVGTAYSHATGERNLSDLYKTGGGGEIHGGVRFARYFAAKVFFEAFRFEPGAELDKVPDYDMDVTSVDSKNTATADGFGLGVMGGLIERGRFGAFGELDFVAIHRFSVTRDVDDTDPACGTSTDVLTLSGPALRVGGGAIIPLTPFLNLTPFMTATFGSFSEADFESGCPSRAPLDNLAVGKTKLNVSGHQLFVLGVGGDFIIGGP